MDTSDCDMRHTNSHLGTLCRCESPVPTEKYPHICANCTGNIVTTELMRKMYKDGYCDTLCHRALLFHEGDHVAALRFLRELVFEFAMDEEDGIRRFGLITSDFIGSQV